MNQLQQIIRRKITYYRTHRKRYLLGGVFGILLLFSPLFVAVAMHYLFGVGLLVLAGIGGVAALVGMAFSWSKDDEFLVGLWVGTEMLFAVGFIEFFNWLH